MPYSQERPSNLVQFLYAAGVVVLLIAALFLTLEWDYARELFGLGLLIEIIVFLLSSIDPSPSRSQRIRSNGPQQEISFPPRNKSGHSPVSHLPQTDQDLDRQMQQLVDAQRELEQSMQALERDRQAYEQKRSDYEAELEDIRRNIERSQKQLRSLSRK